MNDNLQKPLKQSQDRRVVVVGLDMGDSRLIQNWAGSGKLPNLASLITSGAWLELETTARVLHTSSWPTFATGTMPGHHGVYYPYQPKPGYQSAVHIEPDQYGSTTTLWKQAADAGRRCLVYDLPETFPEAGYNGNAVFDWGTWAWYGTPASQPQGLLSELKAKFGDYPLGFEAKKLGLRSPDPKVIEPRLIQSVDYKRRSLEWLMGREGWDLTVVGFCETHPAGHYLWPANAQSADQADSPRFASIYNVYQAVDEAIGQIAGGLPSGTTLLVLSGDGVRVNRCGWHLLGAMLEKLGFMNAGEGQQGGSAPPRTRGSMLSKARRMMPPGAKRWIADHLPWSLRDRIGAHATASEIDWSSTRAFPLPTDLEGCIRINLKGREPNGIVEPGAEYEDVCRRLREDLLELVNPANDRPAVRHVWVRNEVFPGERQEHLPDLIVNWTDEAAFDALVSPRAGRVEGPSPDPRTGTHSPEAFMLAWGAGATPGTRGSARLVDAAPTVMDILGLDPQSKMEGIPLSLERTATVR